MDCLLIEITAGKETGTYDTTGHLEISTEDFRILAQIYPLFLVAINEHASVNCGKCGSFQVPVSALYEILKSPKTHYGKGSFDDEDEDFWTAEEIIQEIHNSLTEEISATDEEWESFIVKGTPDLRPIYDHNGKFVFPENGGYALRFQFNDVVFKFGDECISCERIFRPQNEP